MSRAEVSVETGSRAGRAVGGNPASRSSERGGERGLASPETPHRSPSEIPRGARGAESLWFYPQIVPLTEQKQALQTETQALCWQTAPEMSQRPRAAAQHLKK